MLRVSVNRARNFGKSERGVVLVLFLALIIPFLILIAVAIDFSQFLVMKRQLQGAADAAALNAATNSTMSDTDATKLVNAVIAANYSQGALAPLGTITLSRLPAGCGSTGSPCNNVKVTGQATMTTTFLQLAGFSTMPVTVSSTASQSNSYFDIYAAVDQSASLGIAADATNRATLELLTMPYVKDNNDKTTGCEFACHQLDTGSLALPGNQTAYDFARANGVSLREDVLNAAFSSFVSDIFTTNPNPNSHRRMDVIGFSATIKDLTSGPTSDQTAAATALSSFPNTLKTNTYFDVALPQIATLMGAQGTGATQSSPMKMLVLITDGVWSSRSSVGNNWAVTPIDMPIYRYSSPLSSLPSPANCAAIKSSNIMIAVIDVQYIQST